MLLTTKLYGLPISLRIPCQQISKTEEDRRTEEGRKPVLFGNLEKNKEALLNRKEERRVDKETVVLSVHMWVGTKYIPSKGVKEQCSC